LSGARHDAGDAHDVLGPHAHDVDDAPHDPVVVTSTNAGARALAGDPAAQTDRLADVLARSDPL
jgi:hypothetical protein